MVKYNSACTAIVQVIVELNKLGLLLMTLAEISTTQAEVNSRTKEMLLLKLVNGLCQCFLT